MVATFPLIILFVIVLIALLASMKWGKKALLAIALLLVVSGAFIHLLRSRPVSLVRSSAYSSYPMTSDNGAMGDTSSSSAPIWTKGIDGQFDADTYPSMQSAAEALAKKVAKSLPASETPSPMKHIRVVAEPTLSHGLTHEVIVAFTDQLSTLRPSYPVETSNETSLLGQPENNVQSPDTVTVWMKQPAWSPPTEVELPDTNRSGTLSAELRGLPGVREYRVAFTEKPWVENLAGYIHGQADGHRKQFSIARSYIPCTTQDQAHQQAVQDACSRIERTLKNTSQSLKEQLGIRYKVTMEDLLNAGIVYDRFTQSFDGSVGSIWREALLLDESADKVQTIRSTVIRRARAAQFTGMSMLASAGGLAFVIFLLYIFLNAATKGYYTVALRIVAVLLVLVFCGVILILA